jgi:signal transduction histidine kinase
VEFRVVQEALTNAVRHANPSRIDIHVNMRLGRLHVEIADDGVGFDPARPRDGLGLRGLEERVKELQGTMTISRATYGGTTLTVRLPVPSIQPEEMALARAAG